MTGISAVDFGASISFKWITWPTCKSIGSYFLKLRKFWKGWFKNGPRLISWPIRGILTMKIKELDSQMIHWYCNIFKWVTVRPCVDSIASVRPHYDLPTQPLWSHLHRADLAWLWVVFQITKSFQFTTRFITIYCTFTTSKLTSSTPLMGQKIKLFLINSIKESWFHFPSSLIV